MADGYVGQINIGNNSYLIGSTLLATSSTETDQPIKEAILQAGASYSPAQGISVHVKFIHENTITDSSLQLKIGTTQRQIINPNGALAWSAGSIITFTDDGDHWVINSSAIDGSSIQNLSLGNITNEGKITNSPNRIVVTDNNSLITTGATLGSTANGTFLDNTGIFRSLDTTDIPGTIARLASPDFTGTPTAPTVTDETDSSTKIATTAFVAAAINSKLIENSAMLFKGTVGTGDRAMIPSLPTSGYQAGDTYRVVGSYTFGSGNDAVVCEDGDLIIAINTKANGSAITPADWTVAQVNINGYLTMSGNQLNNGQLLVANGSTGSVSSAGYTIATPSAGALLVGNVDNGTSAYTTLAVGSNNKVLTVVDNNPTWADAQHFSTHLYVNGTDVGKTSNDAVTSGVTYIHLYDDSNKRDTIQLIGSGGTTITTLNTGAITIKSNKYKSTGFEDVLKSLTLSYTQNGNQQEETISAQTTTEMGYVDGGILYLKSIKQSTASVSADVGIDNN